MSGAIDPDPSRREHVCVLCGKAFVGWGNNPEPLKSYDDGRCCDTCNSDKVIPARLERHFGWRDDA